MSVPRWALVWTLVCVSGISWSFSLTFAAVRSEIFVICTSFMMLISFRYHLNAKEGAGCLTLVMSWMSCGSLCSVSFPHLYAEEIAGCLTLVIFLLSYGCLYSVSFPRWA